MHSLFEEDEVKDIIRPEEYHPPTFKPELPGTGNCYSHSSDRQRTLHIETIFK